MYLHEICKLACSKDYITREIWDDFYLIFNYQYLENEWNERYDFETDDLIADDWVFYDAIERERKCKHREKKERQRKDAQLLKENSLKAHKEMLREKNKHLMQQQNACTEAEIKNEC